MKLLKKNQTSMLLAVSAGGIIEWYELFLYVYWTPLISRIFFANDSSFLASLKMLFVFFIGFLARPLGGVWFGHIGDKEGRKVSFIQSILLMTLPSFAIALMPTQLLGMATPIILCIIRFLQGLPAGGELPGAMCYLAESTDTDKQRPFLCSFSFVGPQIGVIIAMLECYFLEHYCSQEFLLTYGWRLSFLLGGIF
jgi:MFS family permease